MNNETQHLTEEPKINGAGFLILKQAIESLEKLIEHKFSEVFTNQGVNTTRINKRETETEKLEARLNSVEKEYGERLTKLETDKVTTRWWLVLSVAAAGALATVIAAVITVLIK